MLLMFTLPSPFFVMLELPVMAFSPSTVYSKSLLSKVTVAGVTSSARVTFPLLASSLKMTLSPETKTSAALLACCLKLLLSAKFHTSSSSPVQTTEDGARWSSTFKDNTPSAYCREALWPFRPVRMISLMSPSIFSISAIL